MSGMYRMFFSVARYILPVLAVCVMTFGFCPLFFEKKSGTSTQDKPQENNRSFFTLISLYSLGAFQLLIFIQFLFLYAKDSFFICLFYFAFLLVEFLYFFLRRYNKVNVEIIVAFLLTLGFCVSVGVSQTAFIKQLICLFAGFGLAVLLYIILLNRRIAVLLRIPAVIVSLVLFAANIIIGTVYNGSQNWIEFYSVSFQPSEFIKIALVFLAGCSIELENKRNNNLWYGVFCAVCIAVLGYIRDFGTAAVYFSVFLTAICLRRVNFKKILLAGGLAAAVLGVAAVCFPYVAKRLFAFGNAWQNASTSGYQQTRTMIAAASGGLFGVGTDKGYLRNIIASDTDIVFGVLCEEMGIIIAFCAVLCFVLLAFYCAKLLNWASWLYSIPACATAMLFLSQTALNVFGSVDMLPFTGVTLPFISNGGSSLISCVVLIAFIKAAERNYKASWKKEKTEEN